MEKRYTIILAVGLVLCAVLFFIDIYLGAMAVIMLVMLGMAFFIMQDARFLPEIWVFLRNDAKGIVVINRGNDLATKVHVAIVPHNIEFDIPSLPVDATHEYRLPEMLNEAKAVVSYQNTQGLAYSRTFRLSALGKGDDDLLKPLFPLFKWK